MQTMLERIADAEQRADRLLEGANAASRERIAAAKAASEAAVAAALDAERKKTAEAQSEAERKGEALGREILTEVQTEIDAVRTGASDKLSAAVSYLMERIDKAL